MKDPYTVVISPVLTEKSTSTIEHRNQYTFRVDPSANKIEIKNAVESIFDVKVVRVCVRWKPGKRRRIGLNVGHSSGRKEAVVHLREGEKIDLY